MCGITGWYRPAPPSREVLARMAGRILHRGPDEEGLFLDGPVALAIRRLKIIDLDTGQQPYHNEDETVTAVFNGEIYNFQEIRAQLESRGHVFKTRTDGEILVHLYEERGLDFVEPLNGMFAVALWDKSQQRLVLARDRLGIKPLYVHRSLGGVAFASELKCLLELPDFHKRLNLTALDRYLTFEYVPAPDAILEGVHKLPPGHLLTIDAGGIHEHRYWSLELRVQDRLEPEEWEHLLLKSLKESVKRMLVSDVPLGVFLSGGLDSSTVAALAQESAEHRVKTFSIGFQEESFDESSHARLVAQALGTEHHEEILDARTLLEVLEPVTHQLDEPIGDAAILPTYLLARYARQTVTVVLTGEGADELLAGYPTYPAHRLAELARRAPAVGAMAAAVRRLPVSTEYMSWDFKLKRFFRHVREEPVRRHFLWMGSLTAADKLALYTPGLSGHLDRPTLEPVDRVRERLVGMSLLQKIQYLDLHFYLPDDLLVKLDRATMAVSLEGRVPYLDHTFVELAAHLPDELKLKGMNGKLVLKRAVQHRLPASILKRPKKGFGIPVAAWLKRELRPLMDRLLEPGRLQRQGLFRPEGVQQMVQRHLTGREDLRKPLWTLLMFQLWHERYLE